MNENGFEEINQENAISWIDVPRDWRRPKVDESYMIYWDSKRLFGQILPRPNAHEAMAFYNLDEYYTHSTAEKHGVADVSLSQKVQTKLSWWADRGAEPTKEWWGRTLTQEKMRILEVGCGNGANLSIFRSLGHEAIGVEPDIAALDVAREQGHSVFQGTAEELPPDVLHERFDAVVFMHVLEHCIDPYSAVKNTAGLLKPGGVLIAEVPNNECLGAKKFGELWYWLDVPRHLNFFTARSLNELVLSAGLRRDSVFYRGYCRQFGGGWKKSQSHIARMMGVGNDSRVKSSNYWKYLFGTIFAKNAKKYDSIRIVASL